MQLSPRLPARFTLRSLGGSFGLLFITLAVIGAGLVLDLTRTRNIILSERSALATQRSQFLAQWLGTMVISVDAALLGLNDMYPPDELIRRTENPAGTALLNAWLTHKANSLPGVASLFLYDRDCIFRAASRVDLIGKRSLQQVCTDSQIPLENRAYLQYLPAEVALTRRPTLLVARQHISADGQLLGGSVASIPLSYTQDWLASFPAGPNDVLTLTDDTMTILARAPRLEAALGQRLPPRTDALRFGAERSSQTVIARSRIDGRERIFGVSKIENVPLLLFVGFDLEDALADWRKRCWQLGTGFLVLLGLAVVAYRTHRITLRQRATLQVLAVTDALTGVFNRRYLVAKGQTCVQQQGDSAPPLSLLLIDIDHFKSINDRWGHPTGDRVIQSLAMAMASASRPGDTVARMGGEEFALLLPATPPAEADRIASGLCTSIRSTAVLSETDETVTFTISVGVATLRPDDTFDSLNSRADRVLYAAKDAGRDRVMTEADISPRPDAAGTHPDWCPSDAGTWQ